MAMDVSVGCSFASVSILDASFVPVVEFRNVPVIGGDAFCGDNFGDGFQADPGRDFRSD
jgi:hypothetical protein